MLSGRIRHTRDWPVEIDVALLAARAVVLFWSRAWQFDRAVLAREHGIALARHRAGSAAYIPVFLDDPTDLPRELLDYRAGAGDTVQAFNVARYGHEHWTALLDAVNQVWRPEDRQGTTGPAAAPGYRVADTDWLALITSARPDDTSVRCLQGLPEGPAVDVFNVAPAIIRAFANGTNEITAPQLVTAASRLVVAALGFSPTNPQAYVITPADLPAADRGIAAYWTHVFGQACLLGPRMVAAILLAAPTPLLVAVRSTVVNLLESLEN
jgi:hypothetical protein